MDLSTPEEKTATESAKNIQRELNFQRRITEYVDGIISRIKALEQNEPTAEINFLRGVLKALMLKSEKNIHLEYQARRQQRERGNEIIDQIKALEKSGLEQRETDGEKNEKINLYNSRLSAMIKDSKAEFKETEDMLKIESDIRLHFNNALQEKLARVISDERQYKQ